MQELVDDLINQGYLKTPRIISAFRAVDRMNFVLDEIKDQAYLNHALPIGWGQTISQPLTVAFMLELLNPTEGSKILDIGFGSGWQAALLSEIIGKKGKIIAVEYVADVFEFGKKNLEKTGYLKKNVEVFCDDSSCGFPKFAPYDFIIGAAAAPKIPEELIKELKVGGRLVLPVGGFLQKIILAEKESEDETNYKDFPGFVFVPMKGQINQ